jgi:predicted ATPase/signal transduction histidine kinase
MQGDPKYTVAEILYDRGGTTLYRAVGTADHVPIILKVLEPSRTGPKGLVRQRREFEVGRSLHLPTVVRPLALETYQGLPALVLEDFGGEPLDRAFPGPVPVETFLELAIRIAGAVADLHRDGLVHRDLKPENILVVPATLDVKLADLGFATRLPREVQPPRPPELIEGSLPYLSPEQTGRMNRAVDARSDLYALGVTFFQLLTGRLPFEARDPLEWIHCHVARSPPSPSQLEPAVPDAVAAIVTKLLAKMADDRYQTARGLQRDLERCRAEWRARATIAPFALGARDIPDRLRLPARLYGRDAETATLVGSLERVVRTGVCELVLVSGDAGIGKSSLVRELQKAIVRERGFFAAGKCDPHDREVPYSTLVQAVRELVLDVVALGEGQVAEWRRRLEAALGQSAQLVVDVIPALELVMGRQPAVPELPPAEARDRFAIVLRRFIGVFARRGRPLTLALDDLQWADAATVALLEDLVAHPEARSLLLVGTFRENELGPSHPLRRVLAARGAGARLSEIVLGPLQDGDLTALVADTLRCPPEHAGPLAALVREKTGASPFFAIQFLATLQDERLVEYDEREERWRWDIERIRARSFTDNVVELMAAKVRRLAPETREALERVACLGANPSVAAVAAALERPAAETDACLWEALRDGLLLRAGERYRFLHDRVREAAYSLVEEAARPALHLAIGRRLLARLGRAEVEERVFDVVNQLDRGVELVADPGEREAIRRLDVLAGDRARAAGAFSAARGYYANAAALLPTDGGRPEEALAVQLALGECEYLVGDLERAEARFDALASAARSARDRARVDLRRMTLYQGSGRFDEALRVGLEALRRLGVTIPESEPELAAELEAELREIGARLGGRTAAELVDAPEMVDPEMRIAIRLLIETWVPAYNVRPAWHALLIARAMSLVLRKGSTPDASTVFGGWALVNLGRFGDTRSAFELTQAALRLAERYGDRRARAAAVFAQGAWGHAWAPMAEALVHLDRGFREQQAIGDLARAGIAAIIVTWTAVVETGQRLPDALAASAKYLSFAEESRNEIARDTIRLIRQLVPALEGRTRRAASLEDESFDEAACLARFEAARFGAGIALHRMLKQVIAFVLGRYDEALEAAVAASAPGPVSAFAYDATHHLFRGLAAAAVHPQAGAARRAELATILREELERHARWAEGCPANFLHRYELVSAEVARIEGRTLDAERLYEQAIRSARASGFVQHEALAYELASRFWRARGFEEIADAHLREARTRYERWGAAGKVRSIDEEFPRLVEAPATAPTATFAVRAEQLDLVSVAKAAQAISGEIVLDALLPRLLTVVLEQGGAQRGVLLLARDGELSIDAEATVVDGGVRARLLPSTPLGATSALLPAAVVRYVRRTKERVILDDQEGAPRFAGDTFLAQRRPRSLACLPIVRQGEAVGVLYLENDLIAGAFTSDRLVALELIAAQAAISVQNASLVSDEQAARVAAEEARRRSAFLAEAGVLLSESLDYDETLGRLAQLCVRSLADWCVIDVVDGEAVRRVRGAHADVGKEQLLRELQRRYPARLDSRHPAAEVLRTGRPYLLLDASDEELRAHAEDDAHARLLRELGTRSVLAVPLVARGRVLGVMSLCSAAAGGRYGRAELDLAQELASRAATAVDNARLYRAAQEAIGFRDEFLSVASHELYTPMTSLMLSLEAILSATQSAEPVDPRAIRKLLDLVLRQGRRLVRLTGDLLDVARIERGQLLVEPAEVELTRLVRDVTERLQLDLDRARCAIEVRASGPVSGWWDRSRLEQVVTNLLTNAIKFAAGTTVEISMRALDCRARLEVRDRGIGISPERQRRIFDRFERGVSAEHFGGLGLGLYISRRIVEAHGGSIAVESEPGAGSTFTVDLPIRSPQQPAADRWEDG